MGCLVSIANEMTLPRGQEIILTWDDLPEKHAQHTKKEYIKILQDGQYQVSYEIRWGNVAPTTQPLQVTIYKVHKEFMIEALHQHVTVCAGKPITVKKKFPFDLSAGERVCIGAKNFSAVDFLLMYCQFSVTAI
jgi:5'(3')-deoxyribonucleotidase